MKKIIIIAAFLVAFIAISTPTFAKTDIFGDGREFSVTYGDELAVVHAGFQPLEDQLLSHGFVLSAVFDKPSIDSRSRVDDWMAGWYFEHPLLQIQDITPLIPDNWDAELVGGCELQYLFGTNTDLYFTPYLGAKVYVSKNVSARIDYRYNQRNTILDTHIVSIGAIVEW